MKAKELSKKDATIDKVRLVLDNPMQYTLQQSNEKYLKTLQDRLLGSSLPGIRQRYAGSISHFGSLQPYVTIHKKEVPEKQQLPEFKELPSKEESVEEETQDLFSDEELFEVERIEYDVPEFIEVKPKETEKKEETPVEFQIVGDTTTQEIPSPTESSEEELPEFTEEPQLPHWEPVKKPASEKESQELQHPVPEFTPTSEEEKPDETQQPEPVREEVSSQEKLHVFKGLNSIDEKLAILLYDHGFTSIESLKQASLKELRTIKGVTRIQINAIKKEVEKEPEWETIQYDHEEEAEPQVQPSKPSPNGWEPVEQEASFKKKTKEPIESTEEGTSHPEEIFKDIPSVDPPIAQLLFNHGITSIETLQQTTIKDLTKIRGIKRSVAKRIKQDLHNLKSTDKNNVNKTTSEPSEEPVAWEEVANEENDIAQSESNKKQGYRQGEFVLYKKEVTLSPGTTRTIHFFSKEQPEEGTPTTLPDGYEIEVNKRTGVPYIRKKR